MNHKVACLLGLVLLVVVACAPAARPTPSGNVPVQTQPPSGAVVNVTPPPAAIPTVEPTVAPKPLNVQVKVDPKVSASAVISATGGTLSVQAADGTKSTLTFPEGALFEDTEVTLTPLTGVDGLPFSGGLVGGVQMAPEGLRLLKPATLAIESAKTVAAAGYETVAFAYHQNGEGMYLNPSDIKGNVVTLEVWHFSGAGVAQGTAAEIQAQQQKVPSNAEDALAQRVGEYVRQQHEAQERGESGDPAWGKKMAEYSREYYDRFIASQLSIAVQDCEAAPGIMSKALGWLRQVNLLGVEKDFQSEDELIWETLRQATVNCYNKEYDQCLIDNDIKHRAAMLGHLRLAALLGFDDRLDQSKVYKCPSHYRVDGVYAGSDQILITGEICGLDKPFTLKVNGHNPSGGQYVGEIVFTPTSLFEGSWKHTASTCEPTSGMCATINTGSIYQAKGISEGKPMITMDPSTESMTVAGKGKSFDVPASQFELQPGTGTCSAK
jgi:hypothetical protein